MNNMFAQQTADAIETLTARDDSLRKALTFLARRIKAIDGHIGIDSAQEARGGRTGKAYVTKVLAGDKPRARYVDGAWITSEATRAAGASACKRLGVPSVRWSVDREQWEPA